MMPKREPEAPLVLLVLDLPIPRVGRGEGLHGGYTIGSKVTTEDKTKDSRGKVDDKVPDGSNDSFHVCAESELEKHVEGNVDDTAVEEDGDDKAVPLIWSPFPVLVLPHTAHSAEFIQSAFVVHSVDPGGVWTWPVLDKVGKLGDVGHAWYETGAHVNHDVLGGSNHWVEGFGGDGVAAVELGVFDEFANEDSELDDEETVGYPGS